MASVKPKIKRFFENKTTSGRTRMLTDVIRNYVNDSSDYHIDKKSGRNMIIQFLQNLIYRFYILLRIYKIPLFNPESRIKVIFNSVIVTYNCFYLFIISLKVFFQADFGHKGELFHEIALVCWVTEMLLEMNTATYHHNTFITDRKTIMKIYLKEYFFFEILPLIFEGRSDSNLYYNILLHLPLLLKIKGMMINLDKLEFYILQLLNKQHLFQLFKLIMQMLLLSHIVACLWNCISQIEVKILEKNYTWIEASHIIDGKWWKTYLYAQYWAFTTMKNVGTTPNTEAELVFTSVCMILSCIAFGYLLNAIGNIIEDIAKKDEEYKKDLNILNTFMKRREITLGLKRRANIELRKFYEHQRREKFSTEKEILNKLNTQLLNEICVQSSKKILQNFPFFYKLFSDQTIMKLYGIMEEVILAPSQIVFDQTHIFDESYSVYLIVKGSVLYYAETLAEHEEEVYNLQTYPTMQDIKIPAQLLNQENTKTVHNRHNHHYKKKVKVLTTGQSFGIVGFFTGKQRVLNVQSNGYATVIKIERNKFLQILEENKNDYEKFMEIRDKLMFEGCFEDLQLFCYICGSKEHLSNECTKVHFHKKNQHIYFKYNYSTIQKSNSLYKRKRLKSKSALQDLLLISQIVENFQKDYSLIADHTEEQMEVDDSFNESSLENLNTPTSPQQQPPAPISLINQVEDNLYPQDIKLKFQDGEDNHQFDHCESEIIHNQQGGIQTKLNQNSDINSDLILSKNLRNAVDRQHDNKILRPAKMSAYNEREFSQIENASEEGNDHYDLSRRQSSHQKEHYQNGSQRKIVGSPRKKKNSSLTFEDSVINLNEKKQNQNGQRRDSLNNFIRNIVHSLEEQLQTQLIPPIGLQNFSKHSELGLSQIELKNDPEKMKLSLKKSKHHQNNQMSSKIMDQNINKGYMNGDNQNNQNGNHSNNVSLEKLKTMGYNYIYGSYNNNNGLNRISTNHSFKNVTLQQQIIEQQNFMWSLDSVKNYTCYFPYYNSNEVIKRHNTMLFRISKKRRTDRRKHKTTAIIDPKKARSKVYNFKLEDNSMSNK